MPIETLAQLSLDFAPAQQPDLMDFDGFSTFSIFNDSSMIVIV
jgi:hypothetical protein